MADTNVKEKLDTSSQVCANCGGKIIFNPETQMLECEYCHSNFELPKTIRTEEKSVNELFAAKAWKDTEVIQCNNCGSKVVVSKGEISNCCSFCGTNNIVKTSEIVGMKPHGICPFEKTSNEANTFASDWAKGRFWAPRSFKKSVRTEALKGVYTPAFTFDCDTTTSYKGVLGEIERETVRRFGKEETRSYTRYFDISGRYERKFDDLLVYSSSTIAPVMLDKLEPFPTKGALEYNEKYLAGFSASTYSKDGNETWKDCQQKVSSIVKREILSGYRHDVVKKFDAETSYFNTSFKYLLLPTYVGHYLYKGKNYNFYVNGSTGKVAGRYPLSVLKILFAILLGSGLLFLFIMLIISGGIN